MKTNDMIKKNGTELVTERVNQDKSKLGHYCPLPTPQPRPVPMGMPTTNNLR